MCVCESTINGDSPRAVPGGARPRLRRLGTRHTRGPRAQRLDVGRRGMRLRVRRMREPCDTSHMQRSQRRERRDVSHLAEERHDRWMSTQGKGTARQQGCDDPQVGRFETS